MSEDAKFKSGQLFPVAVAQAPRGPKTLRSVRSIFILAIVQIAAAIYMFVSELVCMNLSETSFPCHLGNGIWVGILCLVNGAFGIVVYRRKTQPFVITCLVLSIVCAVASIVDFAFSVVWAKRISEIKRYGFYWGRRESSSNSNAELDLNLAINILVALVAVSSAIACVISSALMCCNAKCCCGYETEFAAIYVSVPESDDGQHHQQVIVVPTRGGKVPKVQLVQTQPH